jgi:hypothetical protein
MSNYTGNTIWTKSVSGAANALFSNIAASTNGQYVVATNNTTGISYSSDYGVTWSSSTVSSINFKYIAITGDGSNVIAAPEDYNGFIRYSSDYGATFSQTINFGGGAIFKGVSVSPDGTYGIILSNYGVNRFEPLSSVGTSSPISDTEVTVSAISSNGLKAVVVSPTAEKSTNI